MRKSSGATIAMIMGIALYFALVWGFEAFRVLTSPTYGLEDVWSSQYVFGIGSLLGSGPTGLIQLAAFLGVMKFTVAGICAAHIVDRVRSFFGGNAKVEFLEGGLILVVLIAIVSAAPALLSHNNGLLREQIVQLAIAGIALALCMIERNRRQAVEVAAVAVPQDAAPFTPWR
jgi:hypothetical protein